MRIRLKTGALGLLVAAVTAVPAVADPGHQPHAPKAPKAPKAAPGLVSLTATPSTVTSSTTDLVVSGNLWSTSGCRKDRTVSFAYTGTAGTTALPVTAETGPNGDFTATLPKPTDAAPATVQLEASVAQGDRKVGGKKKGKKAKKGRKIICLAATGQTTVTVAP
jgi:hypothetical protein